MNRQRTADRSTWLATLLAAAAAAAGLLAAGLYRDAPFWVEQARATDIATLFFAVPILVAGLLVARRDSAIGRLATIAGLLYLIYNYAIFSFSVAMNPLSVVYIVILGLAVWSLVLSLSETDLAGAARALDGRILRRSSATALIVVAGLFGLRRDRRRSRSGDGHARGACSPADRTAVHRCRADRQPSPELTPRRRHPKGGVRGQ